MTTIALTLALCLSPSALVHALSSPLFLTRARAEVVLRCLPVTALAAVTLASEDADPEVREAARRIRDHWKVVRQEVIPIGAGVVLHGIDRTLTVIGYEKLDGMVLYELRDTIYRRDRGEIRQYGDRGLALPPAVPRTAIKKVVQ